jgi:GH43 family beta-xylosidase
VSSPAAFLRWPSVLAALVLAGCGGGSGGSVSAPSTSTQTSGTPAPSAPGAPAPADPTFVNPVLAVGPDPYVVRMNGVYYYTHTSGNRIALWATKAMSRLDQARPVTIFVPPPSGANSRDLWAPELHRLDGKWYVYYAAGDGSSASNDPFPSQRMFVLENVHADPLQGTWIDRGRLSSPDQDTWAIDGTVLEYGGQHYFIWSGRKSPSDPDQHLYIARMVDPSTLAAGRVLLSSPDRDWERAGSVGVNEGPQILRNRWGDVFLVYSASGCWTDAYALGMLTLRAGGDPLDRADWVKSDRPVFATNGASAAYGPGHNAFFTSPDGKQDWILYHANSSAGEGCGDRRSPRMQAIEWRDDGTPDFGTPVPIGTPMTVPSGDATGP